MANKITTISDAGVNCIRISEGLKLQAYRDSGGLWTIGIGTTRYPDGTPVKACDTCTADEAFSYLRHDAAGACKDVDDLTRDDLTQDEFDALVSLVYNIGRGHYATSSVRRLVNLNPTDAAITAAFAMWDKVEGKVIDGQVARRAREAELYFSNK